ncbi:uncharacterized protein [Parasteatoda tepidariorum]|uniref:uncharacterized protein n=1 Tax=Parasteatoda tepidariorum TaxID=114398 RepID=UPI0039BC76E6
MMELEAELPMFDEEDESDDEFDDDEVVEKGVVVDGEVFDCEVVGEVVVEEKVEDDFTSDARVYPTYLFTEEMIARLYKLDTVHEKDSIAYGIPDIRLEKHDGFFIREKIHYYDISDIDLNIIEHVEKKIEKKGCFSFFSRIFNRFFKK